MKITIIYDNTKTNKKLTAQWGFACLIETSENGKMLFDTGACGHILIDNMTELEIDPKSLNSLFISHNHFDHTGGLTEIIYRNPDIRIYTPNTLRGLTTAKNVVEINRKSLQIEKDMFTTGLINNIEQSLLVKTEKGLVIVTGCSHPGVAKICRASQKYGDIYALVGGLHDFSRLNLLENIPLICPTHCTRKLKEIKKLFPDKYIKGGAGTVITFN